MLQLHIESADVTAHLLKEIDGLLAVVDGQGRLRFSFIEHEVHRSSGFKQGIVVLHRERKGHP